MGFCSRQLFENRQNRILGYITAYPSHNPQDKNLIGSETNEENRNSFLLTWIENYGKF